MVVPAFCPWYERYPARFEEERAEMEARGFVLDAELMAHGVVAFQGASSTEPARPLHVIYPDSFPSAPPIIRSPRTAGLLQRHQRPGDGELCLFGRQQSRWNAGRSGTAALDEAEEVLRLFGGDAPRLEGDDVPEPASDAYHYDPRGTVLVLPTVADLTPAVEPGTRGSFRIRVSNGSFGTRCAITHAAFGGSSARDERFVPGGWTVGVEHSGTLVYLAEAPPYMEGRADFESWVRRVVPGIERKGRPSSGWYAFIFPEESGTATNRRLAWLAVEVRPNRDVRFLRTYALRQTERDARVPGLGSLASKKVVVVGCGSLGSKVAVALAATGVGRFGLVDADQFEPANTIRHEVGIEGVGLNKGNALAARLQSINPLPEGSIEVLELRLGSPNGSRGGRVFYELLASADLVVDATASHTVARHLTDVTQELGIPVLHVTVTNGAWGGEIVRVVTGQSACWLCWRAQYEHDRPPAAPTPAVGVFAPGCAQPTFSGTTFEVGMVANLAAWAAVETMLRDEPGRPAFPGNYVRWHGRSNTGVPVAAAEFLPTEVAPDCPFCRAV